jgi:hypothetical protein
MERSSLISELERCAREYAWRENQDRQTASRSEQNASLAEISRLTNSLATRLRGLDLDALSSLQNGLPLRDPLTAIDVLADQLDDFHDAAGQALSVGKKSTGRRVPIGLNRTVTELASLYERATGKRFSHNPKRRTDYLGTPQSPAGRFIVAFFKIVDPAVSPTPLAIAMAAVVKTRNLPRNP